MIKKEYLAGLLFAGLLAGFVFFGTYFPCRVSVSVLRSDIYCDSVLSERDFEAVGITLFGVCKTVPVQSVQTSVYNHSATVSAGGFTRVIPVEGAALKELTANYEKDARVGDTLDASAVSVMAVYEDYACELGMFSVEPVTFGMQGTYEISVATDLGDAVLTIHPEAPSDIQVTYGGQSVVGETFDESLVSVQLLFEDGSTSPVAEFELEDAPEVISDDMDIFVHTEYGDGLLELRPLKLQSLSLEYTDDVYEGFALDESKLSMTATLEDGKSVPVSDFTLLTTDYIKTETKVSAESVYGKVYLTVEPVALSEIQATITDGQAEGEAPEVVSVTAVYVNGQTKDLPLSDVEFTNLPGALKAGENECWLYWHGLRYPFTVTAVPYEVSKLRREAAAEGTQYTLTEKEAEQIAILCQRTAADNLSLLAKEVSLLANRYELYSGQESGNGTSLLSYVKTDGYWGIDLEDYVKDHTALDNSVWLVKDVLCNGYRALPLYVDERDSFSALTGTTSRTLDPGTFTQDATVLTGGRGTSYRYFADMDSFVYGYTEPAYMAVMGEAPVSAEISASVPAVIDDGDGIIIG